LALAGFMLGEGMKEEAFRTAWGIYHVSYETKGYWFRTPEAWEISGNYRASMYMRPAAIWAMEMTQPPKKTVENRKPVSAATGSAAGVGAK
jgi:non-lysosomal glucosylceramidase